MKQIVYISSAVRLMQDNELLAILKSAQKNNKAYNITGVLLYSGGTFIQAIEGEAKDVDKLYDIVDLDPRHKSLIKLLDKSLTERNFPDWSMGFAAVDEDNTKEIAGFLGSTDEILNSENNNAAVNILKTFITTNNLVITH
ncbi:BLUF domain-containing protein [Mucilaginibacter xinganensis]|uniref:BLUF domain-containing protein n=1 Tax=Mucilaginibacter xinganensis TaxID=1234841 RepID=A0A223NVC5_9SPHI|nr:BLUF domain-containing protein [Mucilaginibacter xinganensis]ASU33501.1 hypothetical protein MuYL_1603 [Mucilaginibacter xinganensis]